MGDTITRAKGGTEEREVPVDEIEIPDLWHISLYLDERTGTGNPGPMVRECWHLCHDLLRHIRGE